VGVWACVRACVRVCGRACFRRGSEVHILSEQTEKSRRIELESENLALDGSGAGGTATPGLLNCRLTHIYGYTTDERAMRRLPLARADAAVVVSDVNDDDKSALGGAELQIADSEALTSTILLRRLRTQVECEEPDAPNLTIVTQFVDLLTRRLLERQPDLISVAPRAPDGSDEDVRQRGALAGSRKRISADRTASSSSSFNAGRARRPSGETSARATATVTQTPVTEMKASAPTPAAPVRQAPDATPCTLERSSNSEVSARSLNERSEALASSRVQPVVFHRNYIETTALSLAAHSVTSWATVQMLLNPDSGYAIQSLRIEEAVPMPAAAHPPGSPSKARISSSESRCSAGDAAVLHSFADLSDTLVVSGLGLLVGWRRSGGEVIINPPEKSKQIGWARGDELIVIKSTSRCPPPI